MVSQAEGKSDTVGGKSASETASDSVGSASSIFNICETRIACVCVVGRLCGYLMTVAILQEVSISQRMSQMLNSLDSPRTCFSGKGALPRHHESLGS